MNKLAVASGKGGVGKSMLASSLCLLFNKEQQIVAVDADVDAPNLHLWLGKDDVVAHFSARSSELGLSRREKNRALHQRHSGPDPESGKRNPDSDFCQNDKLVNNGLSIWNSIESISTNQRPVIDREKCNLCGKCVDLCQFDAISINNQQLAINNYFCEGCAACAAICPQNAITMEDVENAELRVAHLDYGFPLVSAQLTPGHTGSGKIVDVIKEKAGGFEHDLMLIDAPAGIGCPVIAALKDVDYAVLVTEPTPSGISDLNRVLEVVNYFSIDFGVVINKWDINKSLSSEIENQFADRLLGKISYDKRIFTSLSSLTPVMETNLPAVGEIKNIFNCIFTNSLDKRPSAA